MKSIFLITTIHIGDPIWQYGVLHIGRRRCVGWFPNITRAKAVVTHNEGDIYENGHYDHCIIEEIVSGLYPHINTEYWYKWDNEEKQYVLASKPKGLERVVNFGIG